VSEATTVYNPANGLAENAIGDVRIFPNPTNDLFIVQAIGLVETNMELTLTDIQGKVIDKQVILPGSTMAFFDVSTLYAGTYVISYTDAKGIQRKKIIVH
jgi:putative heme degradation protein